MLSLLLLVAAAGLIEARPSMIGQPTFGNMVIGGVDASPGEFPWQLSQQRQGAGWSHSCGASLLGNTRALSAAHCPDGNQPSNLRVIAGLHRRSDESGTQTSNVAAFTLHNQYDNNAATFANDISILNLATAITTGSTIQFATLPSDNSNNFAGSTCVISGWGRTSSSNVLPDVLQKASIGVITTAECQRLVGTIGDVWDNHICLYDTAQQIGSCNGDSGGPLNCGSIVAGVTSWGISSGLGNCLQEYPSVYTRTSTYLAWIGSN